jgi:acetyl esterase/lipase
VALLDHEIPEAEAEQCSAKRVSAMPIGTAPGLTWTPLGVIFAVVSGLILTRLLCHFVKTNVFQPAEPQPRAAAEATSAMAGPQSSVEEATTKLRQLAQLRDSGVIAGAEFRNEGRHAKSDLGTPREFARRHLRHLFAIASLLLAGPITGCGSPPGTLPFTLGTAHRNLTFCGSQRLDLYIPRTAVVHPLPVAMYVHGGGMSSGDKSDLNPVFLDVLARAGYAVASIDYRLAPASRFPAQIEDVKCAIRYLRAQSTAFGLDPSEVVAFGTSVGGQLVALAALTGANSMWDSGPYMTEPSGLVAVADMFGPANLTEQASGFTSSGIETVFGRDNRRNLVHASPTHYVASNAPPILLIQGTADTKVLDSQARELYRDLKASGDPSELILVQHMGHMFAQVGSKPIRPSLGQIAQDMVSFFGTYVQRGP